MGRPETDAIRCMAMNQLGNGLYATGHYEDALSVREAELSMVRRLGVPEKTMLIAQRQSCDHVSNARTEDRGLTHAGGSILWMCAALW